MPVYDPPTLFGQPRGGATQRAKPAADAPERESSSLLDSLYDGFYMVFLLRNRSTPEGADSFRERVREFLVVFERDSKRLQASVEDVYLAKFAYCALVDEVVLASQSKIRDDWERRPLQLELFGEQLAGERFFQHLEKLREEGGVHLQVLEVFHMCLLLGFQGKYIVEGSERLGYLTARVGEEIAQHRGRRSGFAPHWAAPDRIKHALRNDVPLWVIASVFSLLGLMGFLGVRWTLERQTAADVSAYHQVVKLAPETAHVTLTLP